MDDNVVLIEGQISTDGHTRGFVRSSSCGVCGSASLDAIMARHPPAISRDGFTIDGETIEQLLAQLRSQQSYFDSTGGVHAVALFSEHSVIVDLAEDVGRRNHSKSVLLKLESLGQLRPCELSIVSMGMIVRGVHGPIQMDIVRDLNSVRMGPRHSPLKRQKNV